jgi:ATP-dependent Clp protease protease subunit
MPKAPIRCFEGTAQPHQPFWKIRNAADTGGDAEIEIYGYLSEYSWLGDEITPRMFSDELDRLAGAPVTLRINSPGGDVIAASVMRAMLTDYKGKITARIDGVCASAATMVALAADKIKMQDSAFFMIHDPSVALMMADLNIDALQGFLDALKSVKTGIIDAYELRTGISRDRLARMMRDETWMSASEAVTMGFADEVIKGGPAAKPQANALKNYVNVPAALLNVSINEPVVEATDDEKRLRDYVQILKGEN